MRYDRNVDFDELSKTLSNKYNITDLMAKCYLVNSCTTENICNRCNSLIKCRSIKEKEDNI